MYNNVEFNFTKGTFQFCFKNPTWEDKQLKLRFKVIGMHENKHDADGYFYNAYFDKEKSAIRFNGVKLNGKRADGVGIVDTDMLKKLIELESNLKSEYENLIKSVIDNIISGEKPIRFSIVGCDYPQYQSWVDDLPNNICAQFVMKQAILTITKDKYLSENVCDYLYKCGELKYGKEFNHMCLGDKFTIKLEELIRPYVNKKNEKENKETERINLLLQVAKETNIPQIINKWAENCNDKKEECSLDMVYLYAMPDGTKKTERHHTW